MNADLFLANVNTRLASFLAAQQFKLIEKQYQNDRQYTVLRWSNCAYIVEIYSDPQGGEVNCRIAKSLLDKLEKIDWKYLYELSPLTPTELQRAHSTFISADEQLDTISRKLISLFDATRPKPPAL